MLGRMQLVAAKLAAERKLTDGYRTVFNNGRGAGNPCFTCIYICSAAVRSGGSG